MKGELVGTAVLVSIRITLTITSYMYRPIHSASLETLTRLLRLHGRETRTRSSPMPTTTLGQARLEIKEAYTLIPQMHNMTIQLEEIFYTAVRGGSITLPKLLLTNSGLEHSQIRRQRMQQTRLTRALTRGLRLSLASDRAEIRENRLELTRSRIEEIYQQTRI